MIKSSEFVNRGKQLIDNTEMAKAFEIFPANIRMWSL